MPDPNPKLPQRRDFIVVGALAFAGIGAAIAAWPFAASLAPHAGSARNFIDVDVSTLANRTIRLVSVRGKPALVRQWTPSGPWIATQGDCSHCACMLRAVTDLNSISDEWLTCPCCASRYDFSGARLSGPTQRPLKAFAAKLVASNTLRIDGS